MEEVNELLNSLVFVNDREVLIDEIETVKRSIFSVDSSEALKLALNKNLTSAKAQAFFKHLNNNKKNIYDGHIIEEILEALRKKASELETVTVYLPINLSNTELSEMYKKLTALLGKKILLKIEKKPELLGGLELEHNGVYLDLSLASIIKKMISQI